MTRARKTGGRVTFVGTGTGDAGLLTVRATEALAAAEVAYLDAAVPDSIRRLIGGEIRAAGPTPAETAKAVLAEARQGSQVARVVVGDPLGSEAVTKEALAVARTVIPFEVVPSFTEAAVTSSYAGVSLGALHTEADLRQGPADYEALAAAPGTLLLTVNAAEIGSISEQLVASGLKPDTPLTVTCAGTTTSQVSVNGTLGEAGLAAAGMQGTLVVTVGKAAAQR